MSVVQPANPRDVQDFQFKLLSRLRIFTAQDGTFTSAVNLVATASKYGLIFVGCPTGIQVIKSSSIIGLEYPSGGTGGEIINYPRREIPLPSQPSHLNVSCDQSCLVVAIKKDSCAHALIYSLPSFAAKNIVLVTEVRLSTKLDTSVLEITWNPGITNILAACLSDGSMVAYELKPSGVDISTLPPATQANCFCWSPKGKQLVVGSEAGTLTQYKPDLKAVKTFSPPNIGSGNVAVVNVLWLSNYQFAAIYRDKVNKDERPGLVIVNAPKTGTLSFVNYEDICYSCGNLRAPQYYLIHQSTWNILMMASANSMEVGVMGLQEDQISWQQWTQEDAARAELPLSVDKQETFPVGLGLDTSSTLCELPWGENYTIPPMPVLHILSHQGVLCLFYAVNVRIDAALICSPPEKLPDESGLAMITTIPKGDKIPVNNVLSGVTTTEASQRGAGDAVIAKTLDQPQEFSSRLHSGTAVTSVGDGQGGMQVNLSQKFETVSTSQPSSSFGFGTTLSGASPGGFGYDGNAASTSFGVNSAGTLSSGFGAGLTVTPSSGFGDRPTQASFPAFHFSPNPPGAPSTVFGTAISNPSTISLGTGLSHTSTSSFGTGLINPTSAAFGTSHGTAPSISFGTGLATQSAISTGSSVGNSPVTVFSAGLDRSSSAVPAAKPTFNFFSTSATTTAANVKPVPTQTAVNFTFTAPAVTSTPITQQISKSATPLVTSQPQSTTVNPQVSFLGGSSASSVQNPEQMVGSSVTITKVPSAVSLTQPAKDEAPILEVKLPAHSQMKQATSPAATTPSKPSVPVNDSVFYNAINEEVVHFECELAALRSRVSEINVEVGSEDEKRVLCQKADAVDDFLRDLEDTTQAQSSEIHGLKPALMEAFALAEEAKSRIQQINNPMYTRLVQSQTLNPVAARCAANMKRLGYYLENQLRQANEQLDNSWLEFQDSRKPRVKNKMHIPSLESVYQAMVIQHDILNKQRAIMADIARRVQEKRSSSQIPLISSAVLARVRDKEAAHLDKGETELSQLAENLVKMKLGPSDVQTSYEMQCRCLSRKKESLLRDMLSKTPVRRVRPTKPSYYITTGGISTGKPIVNKGDNGISTGKPIVNKVDNGISTGKPIVNKVDNGISTGKPIVNKVDKSVATVSCSDTSRLSAGVAITEPKHSSALSNVIKSDSSHSPIFLLRPSGQLDAGSKSSVGKGFSLVGTKSGPPSKETSSGTRIVASSEIFSPTVEGNKAKTIVSDVTQSKSRSHVNDLESKGNTMGDFSFTSVLHNGKPTTSGNLSFGMGLSKVPSTGKLNDASKKLEDYYEELTPPGTPEYPHGEVVSSTGSSVSSSFAFNSTVTPTTAKSVIPSSSASGIASSLQKSPLMSLDSIVSGIGDGNSASKSTTKPILGSKSIAPSLATNASSGTAFSSGSLPLSQPQQGGKGDEQRKPSETLKLSLTNSPFSFASPPSLSVRSIGDTSQLTSSKAPANTTGVNLQTPLFTTFGTQNPQGNSPPQVNIFGNTGSQKPSHSFFASGCTSVSSSSTNISTQAATSVFGNTTGSPAKQPASSTSSGSTLVLGKETIDTTSTVVSSHKLSELQKPESSPKDQSPPVVTSFPNENLFSQSTSLFGSLSIGSGSSSKPALSGSIFGGGSASLSANIFGKQPASTESQNSSDVQTAPEATAATESSETHVQKSESPLKNTQGSASKPATSTSAKTPATVADERSKLSEEAGSQVVVSTSSIFGGAKTESTTAFSFSQLTYSPSAPQTSVVFGETSPAAKPLTGSIFGPLVTPPATSQKTVEPLTSAATTSPATQTTSSASTTFSFALPTSTPSSAPFGQKTTSLFGLPVSSAAAATSSASFFGQSICSPTTFGQSGGSVFGQPPATTVAKTYILGQAAATTTAPSVFGQGSTNTTSLFGQASSTGSLFLGGGSTGGFGSKPIFGQSGFGQTGSSGFGTSGGSVFGGGGGDATVFVGSGSTSPGNPFQSSTGGSIFGGSSSASSGSTTVGAFSSALGQSVSQSGFGSPTAFQSKPGGFGSSPVFDRSASGFGTSPTFGGAPTFGGSPTFGSPGKVFGSSSPTSSVGFGSTGQQSSTFESLASQNTMTFGNLAQNQGQGFGSKTQPIFGGSQTQQQASTPTFGGSSFSSWR